MHTTPRNGLYSLECHLGNEGHIAEWPLESLQGKRHTRKVYTPTQNQRGARKRQKKKSKIERNVYHAFLLGERDIVVVVVVVLAVAMIRFIVVGIVVETFLAAIADDLLVGVIVSIGEVDRFRMFSPCRC